MSSRCSRFEALRALLLEEFCGTRVFGAGVPVGGDVLAVEVDAVLALRVLWSLVCPATAVSEALVGPSWVGCFPGLAPYPFGGFGCFL